MKPIIVESQYASTRLENEVIFQVIHPGLRGFNLKIAQELVADRKKACQDREGETFPVLLSFSNMVSIDDETRKFYSGKELFKNLSAIAILMDNYVAKLILDLVYFFNRPPIPMQPFANKEKALRWLEKYKAHNLN